MAGTAYIIKTSDGKAQINYSDGSVQIGTEEQLRATLAKNLPSYDIKISEKNYTSEENLAKHQAKYDKPGDFGNKQAAKYNPSSNPSPNTGSTASVSSGPVANKSSSSSSSLNVNIINKTITESQYEAMLNDPNYRYTAGDETAFTKYTIVDDRTGSVKRERLFTPQKKADGTTYESLGRSTSFGFGDNSSYGATAEEAALIWAKQNSGNPALAAEGYADKKKHLVGIYVSRGTSYEDASSTANKLIYNSGKAIRQITGLDFDKSSRLLGGTLIRNGRNLDAVISASSDSNGVIDSASFINNLRLANKSVLDRGIPLPAISTELDASGNPVDPNGVLNAAGKVVDRRYAQNNPNLTKISENLYMNTTTGQVMAAAGNGVLLTNASNNTLDQMWSYGIGKDQFQKVSDYATNNNIELVNLSIDRVDWDSPGVSNTSFLKEYQSEIEQPQTIKSPESVVPGTTNVQTPQPSYGTPPSPQATSPGSSSSTTDSAQPSGDSGSVYTQTDAAFPTTQTPYTPYPTTVTGQSVSVGAQPTGVYPQAPVTGTMGAPLQTAGMSAVPQTVQVRDNYTGTTMQNLTSQSQQGFGGQRKYRHPLTKHEITVTVDAQGKPLTFVPMGYEKVTGMAEGGDAGSRENEALYTIAKMNGYNGPKTGTALKAFFNSSDALKAKARAIGVAMNKGGYIKGYAPGGLIGSTAAGLLAGQEDGTENAEEQPEIPVSVEAGATIDPAFATQLAGQTKDLISQTMTPQQSAVDYIQPQEADFIGQTAGQTTAVAPMAEAAQVGTVTQAQMPMTTAASTMTPTTAATGVQAETDALQAQTSTLSAEAQVDAQQQLTTSVSGMEAAQGTATMVNAPAAREIQEGEIIDGVADAEKAAAFNEQIQAATATPSKQATVAGQLEGLMQQFEGGNTPAWAAGSMRTAMQTLAARGLGASSLAGQAVIQAAMEAALPIAQMDASTQAQFEAQNLSNRQQRAMLAAQQRAQFLGQEFDQAFQARVQNSARIGDIANMNFTAEQNIALENSRAANTMNLNNLSNRQAMVMAEAAALSQLDMANLNNRQQAAVQNAQNFLQMDMANLNNEQQTAMFKAQQNIQALFTDQAAENAAAQFNATSENQTNQFFANLSSQTSQFNAAQQNAMDQFNVNSINALREFNAEIQQQRDMFNAQNGLVVAQANAQWRQNIATLNTAAQNESNMNFAKTMNAFTSTNLDAYWQRERDVMSFAFTSAENAADRLASVLLEKLSADNKAALADAQGKGTLGAVLLKGALNYMATGGTGNVV